MTSKVKTKAFSTRNHHWCNCTKRYGLNVIYVQNRYPKTWIVDSRASNHMTGNAPLFQTLHPHLKAYIVRNVNGSTLQVTDIGYQCYLLSILNSLLLILKISYNLLSITIQLIFLLITINLRIRIRGWIFVIRSKIFWLYI